MWFALALWARRIVVYYVALRVYVDVRWTRRRARAFGEDDARYALLWSRCHRRCARRLLRSMLRLRGLWLKAGQYVSTRADVVPVEYVEELMQLQDAVPAEAGDRVRARLERELARAPFQRGLLDVFANIDLEEPLGCASIAQVHRARLRGSNAQVVVKLRHRGVKRVVEQDLENLRIIFDWIAYYEPDFDWRELVREWSSRVREELDFRLEATNLQRTRNSLAQAGMLYTEVLMPQVFPDLVSERLLVMEYMEGVRITAFGPDGIARNADGSVRLRLEPASLELVMQRISRAFAHQMLVDGVFNGDPHGGNILVCAYQPGVYLPVLLDFGLVIRMEERMRQGLARMMLAASDGDTFLLIRSFAEMGIRFPGIESSKDVPKGSTQHDSTAVTLDGDPGRSMEVVQFLFRSTAPIEEAKREQEAFYRKRSQPRDASLPGRNDPEAAPKKAVASKPKDFPSTTIPGSIMFMMRVVGLLRGLASTLGVRHAFLPVFREYALRSLPPAPDTWISRSPARSLSDKVLALCHSLKDRVVGIQVAVYHKHRLLVDVAYGRVDPYSWNRDGSNIVTPKTLFSSFSTTKGITAMLVARALHRVQTAAASTSTARAESYDEGSLARWRQGYHTPVHTIWPEFGTSTWKRACTIGHIMSHRSGLQHALPASFSMCNALNWDLMVSEIAQVEPVFEPGTRVAYQYLSFSWLAGGILERCPTLDAQRPYARVAEHLAQLKEAFGIEPDEAYIGLEVQQVGGSDDGTFDKHGAVVCDTQGIPNGIKEHMSGNPPVSRDRLAVLNKFGAGLTSDALLGGDGAATAQAEAAAPAGERAFPAPVDAVATSTDPAGLETGERPASSTVERAHQSTLSVVSAASSDLLNSGLDAIGTLMEANDNPLEKQQLSQLRERIQREKLFWVLDPCFFNHLLVRKACLPAANGHFTARALARFYDKAMQQPWWRMATEAVPDSDWTLGGLLRFADGLIIGHGGIGGSFALAIPKAQLTIAITVNRLELSRNGPSVAEHVLELVAKDLHIKRFAPKRLFRRR
jgi:aarF domain-containing kinase